MCFSYLIPSLCALGAWHTLRSQSGHKCEPLVQPLPGSAFIAGPDPESEVGAREEEAGVVRGAAFSPSETGSSQNPGLPLAGRCHTPKWVPARTRQGPKGIPGVRRKLRWAARPLKSPPLWFFPNSSIPSLGSGLLGSVHIPRSQAHISSAAQWHPLVVLFSCNNVPTFIPAGRCLWDHRFPL